MLTPHCYYRFSAKRTGGDGTTALLALGYTTEPEAFPGAFDEEGNLKIVVGGPAVGSAQPEETLVDATSLTTNTTFTVDFNLDGFEHFALQGIFSAVPTTDTLTVTVLARVGDGQFDDITPQLFGVANWIDDFTAFCNVPLAASDIRVQYVTSNDAGGDCDLKLTLKRI
jgi:hypothetical protein